MVVAIDWEVIGGGRGVEQRGVLVRDVEWNQGVCWWGTRGGTKGCVGEGRGVEPRGVLVRAHVWGWNQGVCW